MCDSPRWVTREDLAEEITDTPGVCKRCFGIDGDGEIRSVSPERQDSTATSSREPLRGPDKEVLKKPSGKEGLNVKQRTKASQVHKRPAASSTSSSKN